LGKAVLVQIDERCVAAPTAVAQTHFLRNVPEFFATQIPIQDAEFRSLRIQVTAERVAECNVIAAAPTLVGRVNTDVDEEQIQQPVVVKVEENGAGRVSHVIQARFLRDVAEAALAEVINKLIAK